jgi:hypothetical protein
MSENRMLIQIRQQKVTDQVPGLTGPPARNVRQAMTALGIETCHGSTARLGSAPSRLSHRSRPAPSCDNASRLVNAIFGNGGSATPAAFAHRALRPFSTYSAGLVTTWMQAVMLVRTCPTRQMEMAVAATSSALSWLHRPQALHRRAQPQHLGLAFQAQ